MKHLLHTLLLLFLTQISFAQTNAPDFTFKDIEGVEHNLYTYLDQGKVVVIDVSATWCLPCWNFHKAHYLKKIHDKYGPKGTDQVVVLFYEGEANTTLEDLKGTGSATKGDWLTGVEYPVANESPVTLNLNVWAPKGYPTVSVVRPADKKIIGDLFDYQGGGIDAMNELIESAFPTSVVEAEALNLKVYPNPFNDVLNISLDQSNNQISKVVISNVLGQTIATQAVSKGQSEVQFDTNLFRHGQYVVQFFEGNTIVARKQLIK